MDFHMRLLALLEDLIKCFANNNAFFDALNYIYLDTWEANTIEDFTA